MNSTNTRKILLGLALLGATTFAGMATSAQAQPRRAARQDVKEARQNLKQARKAFRRTPVRSRIVRPVYQRARTLQGVVLNDLDGNDFTIRTNAGRTVRVLVPSGEPSRLSRGDTVSVSGMYQGNTFSARSATILRNR